MQARMSARQTIGTNPGVSRRCHGKQRTGGTCVALALIIGPVTRHCKPMAGVVFVATLAAFGLGVIAHCGRQRRIVLVGVGVGALAAGVLHSIQERVCRARARAQASGGALRAPGCGGRAPARSMHVRRRVPRLALARVTGAWHAERRCVPHRRVRRARAADARDLQVSRRGAHGQQPHSMRARKRSCLDQGGRMPARGAGTAHIIRQGSLAQHADPVPARLPTPSAPAARAAGRANVCCLTGRRCCAPISASLPDAASPSLPDSAPSSSGAAFFFFLPILPPAARSSAKRCRNIASGAGSAAASASSAALSVPALGTGGRSGCITDAPLGACAHRRARHRHTTVATAQLVCKRARSNHTPRGAKHAVCAGRPRSSKAAADRRARHAAAATHCGTRSLGRVPSSPRSAGAPGLAQHRP